MKACVRVRLPPVCLLFFAVLGCDDSSLHPALTQAPDKALEAAVAEGLSVVSPTTLPEALADYAQGANVLLVGETHYQQEHHETIAGLVDALHPRGLRWFAYELPQAYSWMAEGYVQGERTSLPDMVRSLSELMLDRIRERNRVTRGERIHVHFFDVNHRPQDFLESLTAFEEETGVAGPYEGIREAPQDSAAYHRALVELAEVLAGSSLGLPTGWRDLLRELVKVEIRSHRFRRTRDFSVREQVIVDNLIATIDAAPGARGIVSIGRMHARKATLGQRPEIDAGERLTERYGHRMRTVGAFAIRGRFRTNIYNPRTYSFDALEQTGPDNLVRILGLSTGGSMSGFLPLEHQEFHRDVTIHSMGESRHRTPPAAEYDAIITHPKVRVLRSLSGGLENLDARRGPKKLSPRG